MTKPLIPVTPFGMSITDLIIGYWQGGKHNTYDIAKELRRYNVTEAIAEECIHNYIVNKRKPTIEDAEKWNTKTQSSPAPQKRPLLSLKIPSN